MSSEFASKDLTIGQINAIVKKLGGHAAALQFLRGETVVSGPESAWREMDGVICFSVTSDGTTGEEWISLLEEGFMPSPYTKSVLRSPDFKPTRGVTTELAVLKGMLFGDNDRITRKIRAVADERKLRKPNAEVACLIRQKFTDREIEAMGLHVIVTMHEPIADFQGTSTLFRVTGSSSCGLRADHGGLGDRFNRGHGFAFIVRQASA